MPTAKEKGGSAPHRYRPASEYDDATLVQKRQYWRTKKREQRARLTERRGGRGGKFVQVKSTLSGSFATYDDGNTAEGSAVKATGNQRDTWRHALTLDKVLPASATAKCSTTRGAASRAVTSVPPARVTRTTNGSSAKPPQPCVSMQQQKAQVALGTQPKLLPTSVTTGMILVSSPSVPVSIKTENTSPQSGTKSALVTLQRAKGVSKSSPEPEEERAAKRREQWRIKKREQRAKLAKARETARKAGPLLQQLPSQPKQCPARVRASIKREKDELQSLATVNLQSERIKVQNLHVRTTQTAVTCGVISQRKLPSYVHLSNVTRGIARCRTPRQRFIEAQRAFTNQRITRCKSPLLTSVFGNRNIPQIDPNDTPEQIVAKRREYWRIKKREQRAKLSMEMKARLKEKDALMRRMKRYHSIMEEMRRARALSQSSETIGGFIKEDGTVTVNIPQVHTDHTAAHKREEERPNNTPVRPPQPPPAQVKVTFPLAGQSVNQPPRLLPIRPPSTTVPNSHKLAAQLTLTHPHTPQNAFSGSNLGGCVMKMAVSSSAPSLSALCLDPEMTEEERMAKKREYWRVKKREQRAARAARLRQGVLQARAHATLQRRRAQKLAAVSAAPLARGVANRTGSAQPFRAVTPHVNEIKQESEPVPAVDLHSEPEQAICPHIKAQTSPPPPPDPQPEPDPALSADSQATTLLAVASMKKLLEESLSTVTECSNIKIESTEEASEAAPVAADLTLEIKSWQADTDTLVEGLPSPPLKDSPHSSDTFPPFPTPSEEVLQPTCEHSSQTPSNFIVNPSGVPTIKTDPQSSCSPEPPKLHHLPVDQQQRQAPSAHSSVVSLQRKREYWKLMKRQQRARLRARQRERQGESRGRSTQAPAVAVMNTVKGPVKPVLQPRPSTASLTAVTSIPTVLLVSPTACKANQSPDTLQVKLPVTSVSPRSQPNHVRPSQEVASTVASRRWTTRSADVDPVPFLPTLKPPDNPLSSINLQPIEPLQTPLSPIKTPCARPQSPAVMLSPIKLAPFTTMVPPKPIPGEREEDFLKRKREYWRIKKKEQRARKAIQDKGLSPRRASSSVRPILPAQDPPAQVSAQWVSSSDESDHLMSTSEDADPESFSFPPYSAPFQDDPELLFADYESSHCEEDPVSDGVWRNRYLMDYDPLNQLLVCMVCGELQYSHSLEGVRAHIDEAHPDTLTLEPREQRRILEAWDEQVSRRERFFTSQLQQHSGALAEAHGD